MSNVIETDQITPAGSLEDALAAFDVSHQVHVTAQTHQADVGRKRTSIVGQIGIAERLAGEIEAGAMASAADGSFAVFEKSAHRLSAVQGEVVLLNRALRWLDVGIAADAEHAVLVAHLGAEVARLAAEHGRKAAHEAEVIAGMATASNLAGGLVLQGLGPVAEAHASLCEEVERSIQVARKAVDAHTIEMQEQRLTFHKEYSNVR